MSVSKTAQLKKTIQAIKLAKAKVAQDIRKIKAAEAYVKKVAGINDLIDSDDITSEELGKAWDPRGGLKAPGKKFYVEIDQEGDARFVGPMNLTQARLLKLYTEKEATDESGSLVLGPASVVDEARYKALMHPLGGEDPMGISLEDYVHENEDFNDFLRNR